ncbi:unnamed protein product [Ceratitis capitata]|uniref:(Mediterranean fruit fly) hypothetical protein n=1 Tax=Ceratitis capitata TaxID=7213 RepID=A0A811V8F6_CERCA|nr:unnamed protein product [Ceratitis capitata]
MALMALIDVTTPFKLCGSQQTDSIAEEISLDRANINHLDETANSQNQTTKSLPLTHLPKRGIMMKGGEITKSHYNNKKKC